MNRVWYDRIIFCRVTIDSPTTSVQQKFQIQLYTILLSYIIMNHLPKILNDETLFATMIRGPKFAAQPAAALCHSVFICIFRASTSRAALHLPEKLALLSVTCFALVWNEIRAVTERNRRDEEAKELGSGNSRETVPWRAVLCKEDVNISGRVRRSRIGEMWAGWICGIELLAMEFCCVLWSGWRSLLLVWTG